MKKAAPFLILIILFAAAAWYSFVKQPDPVHELPPPPLTPVSQAEPEQAEPQVMEEPVVAEPVAIPDPLPLLAESDDELKEALAEITGPDPLAEYLVRNQVVSRLVVAIDSLTSRQVPPQINPVKAADGDFMVDSEGEHSTLSAENFARYDGYIALMQSLNTQTLVEMYRHYYPLFQQAWEENGGEGSFNDRLLLVIDHLLQTPDVPGPIYLVRPEAVYLFEDPGLEAMTAGQKILVRMGSANAELVKEELQEIRTGLEM
jgi:hypothetical protein